MDDRELELHAAIEDEHWWFVGRRRILVSSLERHADRLTSVAEIGCGTGGSLKALDGRVDRLVGVDISPRAVALASRRVPGAEFRLGDYREVLSDLWSELDAVVMADVIEHVDDDRSFVQDALAAMRAGAILVVTVPAFRFLWSQHDVVLGHRRRYGKQGLLALFEGGVPCHMVFSSYINATLFPAIFAYRLARCLLPSPVDGKSDLRQHGPLTNRAMERLLWTEGHLIGKGVPLPFGTSHLVVVRKD